MMSSHIKTKRDIPTYKHTLNAFTVAYYIIVFPECDHTYYDNKFVRYETTHSYHI